MRLTIRQALESIPEKEFRTFELGVEIPKSYGVSKFSRNFNPNKKFEDGKYSSCVKEVMGKKYLTIWNNGSANSKTVEPVTVVKPEPVTVVKPEPVTVVKSEPVAVVKPEPVTLTNPFFEVIDVNPNSYLTAAFGQ